jgi:KDO2-lipid IV(A) lauroyltransferase
MVDKFILPPELLQVINESHSPTSGCGKIVVGVHLSNFDLAMHTIVHYGWRGLAITVSELPGGYQKQLDLRRSSGMEILTASVSTFRTAIDRLKAGEMVLTGIDRPLDDPKHWPKFFGHPAPLPVHHIYLALKANVPIILLAVIMDTNGFYTIQVSPPIYMKPNPDRNLELISNAEAVLTVAEQFISRAPQQWAMFFPVWPALSETVP